MEKQQNTILIVDDNSTNIDVLVNALDDFYDITVALDGQSALNLLQVTNPDLILLDIMMPGMDGFEVCRIIKSDPKTAPIPIIFLTGITEVKDKSHGFSLGAVDYITKPFDTSEVIERIKLHLYISYAKKALERQNVLLEEIVQERTNELLLTREVTIESLASLTEYRDPETGEHITRTKTYIIQLAKELQSDPEFQLSFDDDFVNLLAISAPLHDIGKVGIPDSILLKPGKLTNEEFDIMKKHVTIGKEALQKAENKLGHNSFLSLASEIAYTHHEKWDGSGYPNGLSGNDIPLSGRLMAIADVYDALISKRVYKAAFTHQAALEIIVDGKGKHFDPQIVDVFVRINEKIRQTALHYAGNDLELEHS